jgi:hypothetical protein
MEPISKFRIKNVYGGNLEKDIKKLKRYQTIFKIQKDRLLQEEDPELLDELRISNEHLEEEIRLLTRKLEGFI